MANVPTPEQIKQIVRSTHPSERQKVAIDLARAPVKAAADLATKVVASASNRVNELTAEVERLTALMQSTAGKLEQRKRMTPQDMRDALNGLFETYNFSPAEELVLMLKDPSHPFYITDIKLRTSVLEGLNSYVMPKLKSTEIKGEVEHKHTIVIKRFGDDGVAKLEPFIAPTNREAIPVESEVRNGN